MTADEKREIESFASEILRRYFCNGDVDFLISTFASDVVWLGDGNEQKAQGVHAVARFFLDARNSMFACRMWNEQYIVTQPALGVYLCCASSKLESLEQGMAMQQRCTFLFRRIQNRLEVVHIHTTVPFTDVSPNELAPSPTAWGVFKTMHDALGLKDRQIDLMLRQLPGGMMICRPEDGYAIKWISTGLCRLMGYNDYVQLQQVTGGSYLACIHPEDVLRVRGLVGAGCTHGGSSNAEYRVLRRDGSVLWVMESSKLFMDTDHITSLCCFVTDISKRVARQKELERINQEMTRQANFLSQLYDTVPCGIVQIGFNPEPHVVFANKKILEIYGIDDSEPNTPALYAAVMSGPLHAVCDTIHRMYRDGGRTSYEREITRADGSTRWVSSVIEAITNITGTRVLQIILTDITENKLLQMEHEQERLIESRSLHTAVCSAYQLILRINLTRSLYAEVSECNYVADIKPTGSMDELFEAASSCIFPDHREKFMNMFNTENIKTKFESGEKELYIELQRMGTDGKYHWLSMHCIRIDPIFTDDKDFLGIVLVKILDDQRTEKARQEQLLRDALAAAQAANFAKSDFLSRMSHDIRTPMNAIIGMSAIGQLKITDSSRVYDCFKKIDTSCRYLLSLINDILDMSRIESGKLILSTTTFDFRDMLDQVNTILQPQFITAGVNYEFSHQEPLECCYVGDALRVNQILMNLLSNALKFTPRGGKVELHICEMRRVNGFAQMEIIVSDTGLGMSAAFLKRLFDPFEQEHVDVARNKAGSGLGLSIVYNLVQLMGGAVDVQSQLGRGTMFTLELPFALASSSVPQSSLPLLTHEYSAEATPLAPSQSCVGKRVLLVEDNEINMEIARAILEMRGLLVDCAENGQLAIEHFQHKGPYYYHGILMDIRMPVLDGLEATRVIRTLAQADAKTVPIIAMSANAFDEDKALAMQVGMSGYVLKPIDIDILFKTLSELI